ncbi:dihydropteroate synthase [bacterium]|nr:dihydropteroate synthase [candidate division CSSED10-310 bacterium]
MPIGIMGILNASPDSFSGDGESDPQLLADRGMAMLAMGATCLDIGGESSAPFTEPVPEEIVTARVIPVIGELRRRTDRPIAVDTYHVATARAAIDAGADIINDITGLRKAEMIRLVADTGADVVIMHMQGEPRTMQAKPVYADVVEEVRLFFEERIRVAGDHGIDPSRIILDPGIGFGKTLEHNLALIRNVDRLRVASCRMLLGASRKSMIGMILGAPAMERLEGSLAAVAAGVVSGADMVRVHDVAETHRFLTVFERIMEAAGT